MRFPHVHVKIIRGTAEFEQAPPFRPFATEKEALRRTISPSGPRKTGKSKDVLFGIAIAGHLPKMDTSEAAVKLGTPQRKLAPQDVRIAGILDATYTSHETVVV